MSFPIFLPHAPEIHVSRWGLPLITNVRIPDEVVWEIYNRTGPAEDREKLVQPGPIHRTREWPGWIDAKPRRVTAGK